MLRILGKIRGCFGVVCWRKRVGMIFFLERGKGVSVVSIYSMKILIVGYCRRIEGVMRK